MLRTVFWKGLIIGFITGEEEKKKSEMCIRDRLIEDSFEDEEIVDGIWEVYHSWIDAHISDYNTDFYYQSRDYIAACYKEGEVLE